MIDITPIVNAVIVIIVVIVTRFVIPWINTKVDAQKLAKIEKWVTIAVEAAEQIYKESGMGEKKKEYVLSFLEKKGLTIDTESVDTMIEAAVYKIQ